MGHAMRKEDYAEIKAAIEGAGYFTTFYPYGDDEADGWMLVLVSNWSEGMLRGNSFRLYKVEGQWRMITWANVEYLIPARADLRALCVDCLCASAAPIYSVPSEIVSRHGLIEEPEIEEDSL
jgi:hypothetical protein